MESKKSAIVFYNVENFYAKNRHNKVSFLPSNFLKWEESRYEQKVDKIAFSIAKVGFKETQNLPLLVGLSEVEDESVLTDLVANENLKHGNYATVLFESLDERRINVGCIYRKDLIEVLESEPIRVIFKNQYEERSYTRDILFLKTKLEDEIIYFFILHLPSKLDLEINQLKRSILLRKIKSKVDEIKLNQKDPNIVIMGDFNDSPTAENIREVLQTNPNKKSTKRSEFYNPMVGLMSYNRGSLVHKKQWMLFDQMLFSYAFTKEKAAISIEKAAIFDAPFLTINPNKYGAFPFRTFVGTKFSGGYSDHFPIYTIIKY